MFNFDGGAYNLLVSNGFPSFILVTVLCNGVFEIFQFDNDFTTVLCGKYYHASLIIINEYELIQ